MKASSILQKKSGYCVSKAVLLAAVARHQQIPSRLGFADVTNHLSTAKLRERMGTDLFIYHGYTEMYLNGKWVKATPAFNLSLCIRFKVKPLEFDGTKDSIFHECNTLGQKHMEYVRDHGHFADLPFEEIFEAYGKTYPKFFEHFGGGQANDFSAEAAAEV
jgi:transglutaminase-like putative cysteine protease